MDHQAIMETLTEDQQMKVFNLMSIGNIDDMDVAARLLMDVDFDINKAAQKLFDVQSGVEPATQQQPDENLVVHGNQMNIEHEGPIMNKQPSNDLRLLYRKYLERKEREHSENFISDPLKKGISGVLSGVKNVWNSVIPVGVRGETPGGEQFVEFLKNKYGEFANNLKFHVGTFEENLQKAHENKKPLLVYIHVDDQDNKEIPREILGSPPIMNLINSKFHSLGLFAGIASAQTISKYVNIGTSCFIAIFRVNLLDEIQLLERIPVDYTTDAFDLEDHLKSVEGNFYLLLAEEDKIKNEVRTSMENERRNREREVFDNYYDQHEYQELQNYTTGRHFNPEHNLANQEKLEEDRILRQMQDEEYKEVERRIREQEEMKVIEESIRMQVEEEERKVAVEKEEKKLKLQTEREEQRKNKIKNLGPEPAENVPGVVSVAFRTPNGNRIERRFRSQDKIQALYDYIDTQDIAFDKNTVRFDLIQPRPFICLENKGKTVNDYFPDSNQEILQIREHAE